MCQEIENKISEIFKKKETELIKFATDKLVIKKEGEKDEYTVDKIVKLFKKNNNNGVELAEDITDKLFIIDKDKKYTQFEEKNIDKFFKTNKKGNVKFKDGEKDLLKDLNFYNGEFQEVISTHEKPKGLFGYKKVDADFKLTGSDKIITIGEVKYIRNKNECEIKNGLSQVIEQAIAYKANKAILVVIDAGRASNRCWNANEIKFVIMFQMNPFNIKLSVVRVRVDDSKVSYEVI